MLWGALFDATSQLTDQVLLWVVFAAQAVARKGKAGCMGANWSMGALGKRL